MNLPAERFELHPKNYKKYELEPVHRLFDVEIVRPGFRLDFEPSRETRTANSLRRSKLVKGNKAHGISFDGSNSDGCSRIRLSSFRNPAPCTPSRALWSQDNVTFMRRPTLTVPSLTIAASRMLPTAIDAA